ncbi:MAG: hypothetical protein HY057_09720 [Rhodospirillales bacterium]|nr:hypothetical protein [Rhodospirillales bacterium]
MGDPLTAWQVSGVSPAVREAAEAAARKAGVPVQAWLADLIRMASGIEDAAIAAAAAGDAAGNGQDPAVEFMPVAPAPPSGKPEHSPAGRSGPPAVRILERRLSSLLGVRVTAIIDGDLVELRLALDDAGRAAASAAQLPMLDEQPPPDDRQQ